MKIRCLSLFYSVLVCFTMTACSADEAADNGVFRVRVGGSADYAHGSPVVLEVGFANETGSPLALLTWGTPLESKMTRDAYDVERNGERLAYTGRRVKRSAPGPADYVTIKPGESVTAPVDLSLGYDLRQTGAYRVRIRPEVLQFADVSGKKKTVTVVSEPFDFEIR